MADPEGTAGPEDGEAGAGIGAFLANTRNLIATIAGLIGAISGLILALNRAGILGGDDEDSGANGTQTTATETTAGRGLFGEITRPGGRVYFDGETMYVRAARPGRPLVHVANLENPLEDVALSARISWVSGARDYGFGLICRFEDSANYYLASILSDGRYNIVRYRDGKPISLVGGIQRNPALTEDENDVTARCVGRDPTTITLVVNGRTIAAKTDADGIDSGNVGIRVGSGESFVTGKFEEFELRYL